MELKDKTANGIIDFTSLIYDISPLEYRLLLNDTPLPDFIPLPKHDLDIWAPMIDLEGSHMTWNGRLQTSLLDIFGMQLHIPETFIISDPYPPSNALKEVWRLYRLSVKKKKSWLKRMLKTAKIRRGN
jgi:hypothetical protein